MCVIIYNNFMKTFIHIVLLSVCLTTPLPCAADLFTASDGRFAMDMPAGWTRANKQDAPTVLTLQKADAQIDIKQVDCAHEDCLDQLINRDLAEVKAKQMTVLKNTYTDEEIKRTEFATGEPFYYIHFYTPKNDFSAGYFLIDEQGYSILSKNVTYAEADLLFAQINPTNPRKQQATQLESDEVGEIDLLHTYNTQATPDVQIADLPEIAIEELPNDSEAVRLPVASTKTINTSPSAKRLLHKLYIRWKQLPLHTLVSAQMPPYIRELGHGFDGLVLLLGLFLLVWCTAGIVRLFIRPRSLNWQINPNSLYPIKLERLYGTPAVFFRAKDNQGNILTALSSRWDALVMFFGIILMLAAMIVMAQTSLCEQLHVIHATAFTYNTIYSSASLVLPLGFLIFFCAIVWGQVTMTEVTLFDRKGQKAAIVLQKGYNLTKERYQLFFVNSKELLLAERKRFCLRRTWKLMSKDQIEFATIRERSAWKALLRMCCGHLWGLLRTDYDITGVMESQGALENTHALFNKSMCYMDKPEAVNARDLLALALLISIRDRDKWYPWFN